MPLVGLDPTSSSPEKQGFSAGRGTDSGTVTDAGKAGDSKEDRWRCFSIRVLKDREFKLASFKWLKEESVEDADALRRRSHPQSIQLPAHRPALPRPDGPDLRHRPPVFLPAPGAPAPHLRRAPPGSPSRMPAPPPGSARPTRRSAMPSVARPAPDSPPAFQWRFVPTRCSGGSSGRCTAEPASSC